MTLKHLFATFTLAGCMLLGFTACNDEDYAPISLEIVSGEGVFQNNVLQIDAYSTGESFYIVGGNGRYVIENQSEDIIDYKYDGHTLTFFPIGIGEAKVVISDHAGNKMTLVIEVNNHTTSFKVKGVTAEAYGDDMTGGNMKSLAKQMKEESLIKEGGDILLTYTDKEQSLGSIIIHPTPSGRPVSGIFRQETKFASDMTPCIELVITLADNSIITWLLFDYTEDTKEDMLLQQNVTETYKATYPELEKATLTYTITHE